MGRKIRNKVSNLGLEGNSGSPEQSIQKTNSNEKERIANEIIEVDLGLDISTSIIGIVLLTPSGAIHKMDSIKLTSSKFNNIFEKTDFVIEWLKENIKDVKIRKIFVEANAKMFSIGFSSADTLFTLAKMNALVSYVSYKQFNVPIIDINVTTARSKIGYTNTRKDKRPVKEKVREFVLKNHPEIPVKTHIAKNGKSKGKEIMDSDMNDIIDAYVVGRGGQLSC
jgi:hypothetical protein